MPAKQDLALYKELKNIKSDFDKEMIYYVSSW